MPEWGSVSPEYPPLKDGKAHLNSAVVDDKIFIIGFYECSNPNKIMSYAPQTDEWTEMSPIPIARIGPIVTVYNGKIYVFGGIGINDNGRLDFSEQLDNIDMYDPKTNTWKSKKSMPDYLLGAECIKVIDNNIYLIKIKSVDNKLKENTYVYNPDTEIWRAFSINLPEHWYDSEGISFFNDKIYIIGGHDNTFKQYSDVYIGTIEKFEYIKQIKK